MPAKKPYHRTRPNLKVRSRRRATLTPEEVAEVSGLGRNKVYELLRSGLMPTRRIGSRFYISRSALLRWLEGNQDEALSK